MYTVQVEENDRPLALMETYMSMVRGSIDSKQYRTLFVRDKANKELVDVIEDGDLACALYVSSVLHLLNLINGGVHTTVLATEKDLIASGWVRSTEADAGRIVLWGEKLGDDGIKHRHIGICLNSKEAVSNCPIAKSPQKHGVNALRTSDDQDRRIDAFYTLDF